MVHWSLGSLLVPSVMILVSRDFITAFLCSLLPIAERVSQVAGDGTRGVGVRSHDAHGHVNDVTVSSTVRPWAERTPPSVHVLTPTSGHMGLHVQGRAAFTGAPWLVCVRLLLVGTSHTSGPNALSGSTTKF